MRLRERGIASRIESCGVESSARLGRHRWVVERTFGWLLHHRGPARDYESHPHRSEAMIRLMMIDLMSRRFTREAMLNWRGT
ncbi:transposase [Streptomyces asoensis]|uniref:transposase n=1 Tax=Streptomyces asoensis TaxID=249586 RepID=UPI0033F37F71